MSAFQRPTVKYKMNDEQPWGLTACGSSGDISIEVNESCSGEELYELDLNTPTWSLRCRIESLNVISRFFAFITKGEGDTLRLGSISDCLVEVRRDDEFSDRFFFVLCAESGAIHLTVAGHEAVKQLTHALEQVLKDL